MEVNELYGVSDEVRDSLWIKINEDIKGNLKRLSSMDVDTRKSVLIFILDHIGVDNTDGVLDLSVIKEDLFNMFEQDLREIKTENKSKTNNNILLADYSLISKFLE